jgi:hypothetical protein
MLVSVSNAESAEIGVFTLDPASGDLAHVENVLVSAPGMSMPLAVAPTGWSGVRAKTTMT